MEMMGNNEITKDNLFRYIRINLIVKKFHKKIINGISIPVLLYQLSALFFHYHRGDPFYRQLCE